MSRGPVPDDDFVMAILSVLVLLSAMCLGLGGYILYAGSFQ